MSLSFIRQTFPPKAHFTEASLSDLTGKVYLITGASAGIGKELTQILYAKNARVYLAARNEQKTQQVMSEIKRAFPGSTGKLKFLQLDLADLTTVKASAERFLAEERRLDVLFNNAGLGYPEPGSKTAQGYELQLGVNCVGPFLFTKFLTPMLVQTAKSAPRDSVRVVWVSSSAAEAISPAKYVEGLDYERKDRSTFEKYCMSKMGNYYHATEYAARHRADGVVSVSLNPGNLNSSFWDTVSPILRWTLQHTILHPAINGAYTELFAGLSPEVTMERTGAFIAPWGRLWKIVPALERGSKGEEEGGNGDARKFWEWSEKQVKPYL